MSFEVEITIADSLDASIKKGGEIDAQYGWMSNKNLIVAP
jgi:hypothetical protein